MHAIQTACWHVDSVWCLLWRLLYHKMLLIDAVFIGERLTALTILLNVCGDEINKNFKWD